MRLALVLPRSVGMASQAELLVIEMREFWSSRQLITAIGDKLREGLEIQAASVIPAKIKPHPSWARYQIHLSKHADREQIWQRLQQFDAASTRPVYRPRRGRHPARTIDLKSMVMELALKGDGLYCTLDLSKQITARLDEVTEILKINSPNLVAWVERISVGYPEELRRKNGK